MDADEDQPTTPSDSDETKRKFREALERKKQAGVSREGVRDANSGVRSQARASGKREFRRKSG